MKIFRLSRYILFVIILSTMFPVHLLISENITHKNGVYFELFGPGMLYSINYERFLDDNITIRVGFTTFKFDEFIVFRNFGLTAIPVTCNYLIGQSNHRLELGVGLEYARFSGKDFWFTYSTYEGIIFIGSIGYRYQPRDEGVYYRLAAIPIFRPKWNRSNIWLGISIGYSF